MMPAFDRETGKETERFFRHNDGSLNIMATDEDGDPIPVLTVRMGVSAKRGDAWKTDDPDQEAFAQHVVDLLNGE
jgi:hypothetical protein